MLKLSESLLLVSILLVSWLMELTSGFEQASGPNLWSQPLDGGPPKQVTDFKSDEIFSFAWSRDGKQLALARGVETGDVVLITDSK